MKPVQYIRHVNSLAKQLDVTPEYHITARKGVSYWSYTDRTVHIAIPVSSKRYYTDLHELGHAADKDGVKPITESGTHMARIEGRAWLWAFDHAIAPPSMEARFRIFTDLDSYRVLCGIPHVVELYDIHGELNMPDNWKPPWIDDVRVPKEMKEAYARNLEYCTGWEKTAREEVKEHESK
jgi:hypothetical protein